LEKKIDKEGLERLRRDIASLNLRFPVKTVADRLGVDRGNLSAYLSGKKPIPEKLLQKFYKTFSKELSGEATKDATSADFPMEEGYYGTSKSGQQNEEIEQLKKLNGDLNCTVQELLKSNRQLVDSNRMLVEANSLLINNSFGKT
jgi:transcriptional regulator with XRE-family HTH domain